MQMMCDIYMPPKKTASLAMAALAHCQEGTRTISGLRGDTSDDRHLDRDGDINGDDDDEYMTATSMAMTAMKG